ncbi:ABC transporter ATP-binding protein [Virgibacillus kimchii]
MIEFKKVSKTYSDGTEAIKNISFRVDEHEIVTIIGPSGCGKTTAMKMVNRLIEPTSGSIFINGQDIKKYNINELRWNIGYVLQEIALFPHMTISENIAVVPEMKKWSRKAIRDRIKALLEMVGLDPATYANRFPRELSGGQQQRIGVVRALAADPDIILMDEPFSALDPISREQLQVDIRNLQKEINKTILFVTHDMDEAMALGDKVILMKDGEIIQHDTPQQLILHPDTEFVRDFIGERKSPWMTAVDVIASLDYAYIMTKEKAKTENSPEAIIIIRDEHFQYEGAIQDGKFLNLKTLENDMPLYRATELLEKNEQQIYPVIKDKKLVGVLTYKDIVMYLKRNTRMENGVVQV